MVSTKLSGGLSQNGWFRAPYHAPIYPKPSFFHLQQFCRIFLFLIAFCSSLATYTTIPLWHRYAADLFCFATADRGCLLQRTGLSSLLWASGASNSYCCRVHGSETLGICSFWLFFSCAAETGAVCCPGSGRKTPRWLIFASMVGKGTNRRNYTCIYVWRTISNL